MTTETTLRRAGGDRPAPPELEPRPVNPVKIWAATGAGFIALQGYVYSAWILSGDAVRTPTGPTPVPGYMRWSAHASEVIVVGLVIFFGYGFLVRPWRRERRVTLDGLLYLAFFTLYWADPLLNYGQTWATYNSVFFNLGSWTMHIPGWIAPRNNLFPEPLLWAGGLYPTWMFGATIMAGAVMRRAKQRRPAIGTLGLLGTCLAFFMVFDFVSELTFMRLGLYTYAGSIDWLTFFHGHYYQFPVYEVLLFPLAWTGFAALRYFRDDKGRTFAERGIDNLRISPAKKNGLRFLALAGALNVLFFISNVPLAWFGLQADTWPHDIQKRSYLTDGICGPGTHYACPGPAVPILKPEGVHVSPDGELVVPPGTKLPWASP